MRDFLLTLTAVAAMLLALFTSLLGWCWWESQPYRIGSIAGAGDLRLNLVAEPHPFDTTSLLYEIRGGTRRVSGPFWMGTLHEHEPQFGSLSLRNGSLIAVYEHEHSHFLVASYDALTGECWPYVTGTSTLQVKHATQDRLLARIKELTGDSDFRMGWYNDRGFEPTK